MSNVEVKKILTDARALVEHGWIKGEYERRVNGVMCYCALGAMNNASIGHFNGDSLASTNTLRDCLYPEYPGIIDFNDAPETAREDVLALFDRAIESVS